ncbi:MAG: Methylase involved in ubiquinone/menaquinone biosynthesis [Rhodobacteraceae bacterium HLUCCA12]|nr:MAG: Methylase involved in ubiquinone/menaquinone biosynthesis [Rhodobacteraceae bacterium HLUCCA12]
MAKKAKKQVEAQPLPPLGPLPFSLSEAVGMVDRVFDVDKMLKDEGAQVTEPYYQQSVLVYEQFYEKYLSVPGCMHFALNYDGVFDRKGFYGQARGVARQMERMGGASQVLEVGCGKGLNTIRLAQDHPDVSFTGLDLLPAHVEKARGRAADLGNASFVQGSFEPLPDDLNGFDLAFGVETLCYSVDLDAVCQSLARALRPGGRVVIFDCFLNERDGTHSQDMLLATRLLEVGWGISQGYRTPARWVEAMERAGLALHWDYDETAHILPNLRKLQDYSVRFYNDWKVRLQARILPTLGQRNAVTALLMPYLFEGAEDDEASPPGVSYRRMVFRKPVAA